MPKRRNPSKRKKKSSGGSSSSDTNPQALGLANAGSLIRNAVQQADLPQQGSSSQTPLLDAVEDETPNYTHLDVHLMTSNGAVLGDRGAVMREGGLGIQTDASCGQSFLHTATDTDHVTYAQDDWRDVEDGKHKVGEVGNIPDDAIYQRPSLERQQAMDLTKEKEKRKFHLGTWTLPS